MEIEQKTEIKQDEETGMIELKKETKTYITPSGYSGKQMSKNRVRFNYKDPDNGKNKYFYFDTSIMNVDEILKKADEIINKNKNDYETKKRLDKIKTIEIKEVEPVKTKEQIKKTSFKLKNIKLNDILKGDVLSDGKKKSGSSFLYLASSKAGKSFLMAETLRRLNNKLKSVLDEKPILTVMSNTLGLDKSMYKTLSTETLFSEYSKELINEIAEIAKLTDKKFSFIISLDDIIDQKNDNELKKLILTYRNLNIYSLIALQASSLFNKSNRGSINHIFIGRQNNAEVAIDAIEKFILGCYNEEEGSYIKGKAEELLDWLNKETNNHNFLYINMLTNKIYKLKNE
jgi:hypothetical protein